MDQNATPNTIRGSKVDLLSTKITDMKGRKVTGAADATNPTDYVTLRQQDKLSSNFTTLQNLFNKLQTSLKNLTATTKLIVSIISPPVDSTTAIRFTKADGVTNVLIIDTTTPCVNLIASTVTISSAGGKIAFFTNNPASAVVKQLLAAYVSNNPGAYSGIASGVAGSPYAQVNDLNNLRTAYNNLRVMCEDLRTKLQTSTLVG